MREVWNERQGSTGRNCVSPDCLVVVSRGPVPKVRVQTSWRWSSLQTSPGLQARDGEIGVRMQSTLQCIEMEEEKYCVQGFCGESASTGPR